MLLVINASPSLRHSETCQSKGQNQPNPSRASKIQQSISLNVLQRPEQFQNTHSNVHPLSLQSFLVV